MGHDKLRKFQENLTFPCLIQPEAGSVLVKDAHGLELNDHPIKGHWNGKVFAGERPIVLELGCGKGEYTIDLSLRMPRKNYIGVDIKGARLWKGAKFATENGLPNVAFLRTRIEFITAFFAPSEVSGIWLTFSDPQMKSENSRLTSPLFLARYRSFLQEGGIVNLKTDSISYTGTRLQCAGPIALMSWSQPRTSTARGRGCRPRWKGRGLTARASEPFSTCRLFMRRCSSGKDTR